ncbi:uncharacterized protein [Amphiura filiformis]|uniref:uncharacterized protein n=1 Tax=Amphiura filiformis TaxID=82378 RepID=UPI003B221DA6
MSAPPHYDELDFNSGPYISITINNSNGAATSGEDRESVEDIPPPPSYDSLFDNTDSNVEERDLRAEYRGGNNIEPTSNGNENVVFSVGDEDESVDDEQRQIRYQQIPVQNDIGNVNSSDGQLLNENHVLDTSGTPLDERPIVNTRSPQLGTSPNGDQIPANGFENTHGEDQTSETTFGMELNNSTEASAVSQTVSARSENTDSSVNPANSVNRGYFSDVIFYV